MDWAEERPHAGSDVATRTAQRRGWLPAGVRAHRICLPEHGDRDRTGDHPRPRGQRRHRQGGLPACLAAAGAAASAGKLSPLASADHPQPGARLAAPTVIVRSAARRQTLPSRWPPTLRPRLPTNCCRWKKRSPRSTSFLHCPKKAAKTLLLYYREGQSSQQVAPLLELSDAAVRKRLSRARASVRSELLRRFGDFARGSAPSAPSAAFASTVSSATLLGAPGTASAAVVLTGIGGAGKLGASGLSGSALGGAAALARSASGSACRHCSLRERCWLPGSAPTGRIGTCCASHKPPARPRRSVVSCTSPR